MTSDVQQVQRLLNDRSNTTVVAETGRLDAATISALARFQERQLNMRPPSARVEPDSATWFALMGQSGPSASISPELDETLRALEAEAVAFAARFIKDARIRENYVAQAKQFADEVRDRVVRGEMTVEQGSRQASDMRNVLMDAARLQNSDVGRAVSQAEKACGKTFGQLTEKYALEKFQKPFKNLSAAQQDVVFAEIIRAAGSPNLKYTYIARNLGRVGKGLVIVTMAFAVYEVTESDRPGREVARQAAGIGAGLGGSMAGGALAGLACGPGAPICVGVGALVGGIVFAVGADVTFTWLWE